jgi:hypothetical protein
LLFLFSSNHIFGGNKFAFALDAIWSFLAALAFSLVNLFSLTLFRVAERHKRLLLSFFGGVAAAYVFLDLLPSLWYAGSYLTQITGGTRLAGVYEDAIFLVVFAGFLTFFILETLAKHSRQKNQAITKQAYNQTVANKQLYIVHFASYAFISLVLSYTLIFEFQTSPIGGIIYAFAVSLTLFISNDTMIEHYKHYQIRVGRYVGAVVPLAGWAVSLLVPEHLGEAYVLLAFISGAILYHSIKNEVPSASRTQSLALFLVGAIFYMLLLFIHYILNP